MRFNPDEYITVHERIEKFYAKWPTGRILTSIVEHNAETGFVLVRAEIYREQDDALPAATGRLVGRTLSGVVLWAMFFGVLGVLLGFVGAHALAWPEGASIVLALAALLAVGVAVKRIRA